MYTLEKYRSNTTGTGTVHAGRQDVHKIYIYIYIYRFICGSRSQQEAIAVTLEQQPRGQRRRIARLAPAIEHGQKEQQQQVYRLPYWQSCIPPSAEETTWGTEREKCTSSDH